MCKVQKEYPYCEIFYHSADNLAINTEKIIGGIMARKKASKRYDRKGIVLKTGEYQRKDGMYLYKYKDTTGKQRIIYSVSLAELRIKKEQVEQDLRDGIKTIKENKLTVNDMFDKYLVLKTELKDSTRNNYKYMYDKHIRETFGKKKITDISYSDVMAFYISLIKEKGFKPISMEIVHTLLHPTFTLAVRDDFIRKNPSDGVMGEIKKSFSWESPKRHALTEQQQSAFVTFVANSEIYSHWLPLFTVLLGTGCRIGEIIGLRWKDCDFENNVISINHNTVYRRGENGKCAFHITTPKTEAGKRTIPMLEEVRNTLLEERKRQLKYGFCNTEIEGYKGFVFVNNNNEVYHPASINKALYRMQKVYNEQEKEQATIEDREPVFLPRFSVHSFRHTFCTRFCENESNIKVIQEIMGHKDIKTTMNIYAEATDNKKQNSFINLQGKMKIC